MIFWSGDTWPEAIIGSKQIATAAVEMRKVVRGWCSREWRHVDLKTGEVRLEPGTTKNKEGRTFPFTRELRTLLEAQHAERERLKKRGKVVPWVFAMKLTGHLTESVYRHDAIADHRDLRVAVERLDAMAAH